MISPDQALLASFEAAAEAASQAEAALRRRMEAEIAAAERARAFAYRRLNLMRTLAHAVAPADSEEAAVSRGLAAVRAALGWETESETRTETLGRLAPVVRGTFASLALAEEGGEDSTSGAGVSPILADFEAWYERAYGRPFWVLFEQEIAEMPLVER
jgi:hypothetical protein